jgi:tRNA/tmRNA/rRNA uracil-C5-methylase (TrmA/RlmC/RlmD family)
MGELKRQMVADLFRRQLGEVQPWQWHPAPPTAKRHRIQLHWSGAELGFHRRQSHSLVSVNACPAAVDPISQAIPRFREALEARILPTKPQRWELATGTPEGQVIASDEGGRVWHLEPDGWHKGEDCLSERFEGFELRRGASGFFQVSPPWAIKALGGVLDAWNLRGGTLFDLYGGVGLFSAMLSDRFQRFVLVESFEPAVVWAKQNLQHLQAECIAADVKEWTPERLGESTDLILLDPPRAGLEPELCVKFNTAKAEQMVLVGCDGAAFCRDLKRLEAWELMDLHALDLFPNTHHVESIALLKKRNLL